MPTTRPRPDPVIPDHEVLRKVGGGAYGEVWLARGVTGALRAVKVLWREDFDDERGFEREFEGILKFEPISRDHPGMVNILHVGRSVDGKAFYYYVMELGDDVVTGREINPVEYEARTLRSDTKRALGRRLETDFCIDVGVRLSEALRHLHDHGLAHRDVKPANIIFVAGKAKLADIGLVATRGQRTFVGTEGFVPPEGPGSAQADVYSLGKVLYEIATGKDRMDFPELPDELPSGAERKRWLALNQVICDTCEPQLSKRRVSTAGDLADALRRLQEGKRRRRRRPVGAFIATVLTAAVLALGAWETFKESPWSRFFDAPATTKVEAPGPVEASIRVVTRPEGADVFDESGELVGGSPTEAIRVVVGEHVTFRVEKEGFASHTFSAVVPESAAQEALVLDVDLKTYSPPQPNEPWEDQLKQAYRPVPDGHESIRAIGAEEWEIYRTEKERPADAAEFMEIDEGSGKRRVAVTSLGEAKEFCWWLATKGIEKGFLTERHQVIPRMDEGFSHPGLSERARKEGLKPFRCIVSLIPFASVVITTEPAGADVLVRDGESDVLKGVTNQALSIEDLRPGEILLIVRLEGYKRFEQKLALKPGESMPLHVKLELNHSVVMDKPWTNGLEMKFVPIIPGELQACIWETRVKDFDAFLRSTAGLQNPRPNFHQGEHPEDHPVVNVSRKDAEEFCAWLTKLEQQQDRLTELHRYRLPTDYEWSVMAGLRNELRDVSPARREQQMVQIFPWGVTWPPLFESIPIGNFADSSAARVPGISANRIISGYDDHFETTAPVGSFPQNPLGIFDLAGNVQEWVSDDYNTLDSQSLPNPAIRSGVLRGGGWKSYLQQHLYTGYRNPQSPEFFDNIYGFRIVLAKDPLKPEIPSATESIQDNGRDQN